MLFGGRERRIGGREQVLHVKEGEVVDALGDVFQDDIRVVRDGVEETALVQPHADCDMLLADGDDGVEVRLFQTRRREGRELQLGRQLFLEDGAGVRGAGGRGQIARAVLLDRVGLERGKDRRRDLAHVVLVGARVAVHFRTLFPAL